MADLEVSSLKEAAYVFIAALIAGVIVAIIGTYWPTVRT